MFPAAFGKNGNQLHIGVRTFDVRPFVHPHLLAHIGEIVAEHELALCAVRPSHLHGVDKGETIGQVAEYALDFFRVEVFLAEVFYLFQILDILALLSAWFVVFVQTEILFQPQIRNYAPNMIQKRK